MAYCQASKSEFEYSITEEPCFFGQTCLPFLVMCNLFSTVKIQMQLKLQVKMHEGAKGYNKMPT
jgi:hypothetical protein